MIDSLLAVGWAGAGRTTLSPVVVHSVSAVMTATFLAGLFWLGNWSTRERRRRLAERIVPFPPRVRVIALGMAALGLSPSVVRAAPSTTYWVPSTANCQAWHTPHITYDWTFQLDVDVPLGK